METRTINIDHITPLAVSILACRSQGLSIISVTKRYGFGGRYERQMTDKDRADELFEITRYMIVLNDKIDKLMKQGNMAKAKTLIQGFIRNLIVRARSKSTAKLITFVTSKCQIRRRALKHTPTTKANS